MTSLNGNIFRVTGPLCRPTVNFLHKSQWRRALMFSLICASINGWGNNRDGGDLRRHRAHYEAIVMAIRWHIRSRSYVDFGTLVFSDMQFHPICIRYIWTNLWNAFFVYQTGNNELMTKIMQMYTKELTSIYFHANTKYIHSHMLKQSRLYMHLF